MNIWRSFLVKKIIELLEKAWRFYLYVKQEGKGIKESKIIFSSGSQVIIGIGARPAVSPFERVGQNTDVGGIQVRSMNNNNLPKFKKMRNCTNIFFF